MGNIIHVSLMFFTYLVSLFVILKSFDTHFVNLAAKIFCGDYPK